MTLQQVAETVPEQSADEDRASPGPPARAPEVVAAQFERDALKKELAASDFAAWAEESFVLARDVAYVGGKLRTQKLLHGHDEGEFEAPPLPEDCEDTAQEVARRRVALAGFQLADRLSVAFPRADKGAARRGPR